MLANGTAGTGDGPQIGRTVFVDGGGNGHKDEAGLFEIREIGGKRQVHILAHGGEINFAGTVIPLVQFVHTLL